MYVYQLNTHVALGDDRAYWADLQLLNQSNEPVETHIQLYNLDIAAGPSKANVYYQHIIVLQPFATEGSCFNLLNTPITGDCIGVKITTDSEQPNTIFATVILKNKLATIKKAHHIPLHGRFPKYAYIANSGDDTVLIIDRYTHQIVGSPIQLPQNAVPLDIVASKYSAFVYTSNSGTDNGSTIYTRGNQLWPLTLELGLEPIAIETDEPYGLRVFAINNNSPTSTVTVFNIVSGHTATIPVGDNAVAISFNETHNRLYVANQDEGTISVIDAASYSMIATIPLLPGTPNNSAPIDLVCSPDGRYVYIAAKGLPGEIQVVETETNTLLSPIMLDNSSESSTYMPRRLSISYDSAILYVAMSNYNGVVSLNVKSPASPRLFPDIIVPSGPPEDICVTPDGWEVYIVSSWGFESTVLIWNRRTNEFQPLPLPTGFQPIRVAFSHIIV
ncbi:YncE family protein [Paenibacillus sp. SC116]|uniref:YncE family protein n=1 Tax=Paenibacillus sp. SC116 TaxID=2968986 RepID=UPI00215B4DFA|nr:YncE family protein [Paenibacillus sp. SC116]MCR8843483.1 YncE family protein [Paenibacillus sp. SC116]